MRAEVGVLTSNIVVEVFFQLARFTKECREIELEVLTTRKLTMTLNGLDTEVTASSSKILLLESKVPNSDIWDKEVVWEDIQFTGT